MTKTLVIDAHELEDIPLGGAFGQWTGTVHVRPDRDVARTSGGKVFRETGRTKDLAQTPPNFQIVPNDDPSLTPESQGYALIVTLEVMSTAGRDGWRSPSPTVISRMITVTTADPDTVYFSLKPALDQQPPLPAGLDVAGVLASSQRAGADSAPAKTAAAQALATAQDAKTLASQANTASDGPLKQMLADPTKQSGGYLNQTFVGRIPSSSRVIYVAGYGNDNNDGRNRDKAFATIGAALARLQSSGGGMIEIGPGEYVETAPWGTINATNVLRAQGGSKQTVVRKAFNGDLATLGADVELSGLYIDAQGATYTGRVFSMLGADGNQRLTDVDVINADGECLYKEMKAGGNAHLRGCTMYRVNAGTTTERYAVVIQTNGLLDYAVPIHFEKFSSAGACAIDFGSCNNVQITKGILGDLKWNDNSRGVQVIGARWLNQMACTVAGHNNVVISDVNPALTIGAGSDNFTIAGSLNRPPVIDNSGNGRNMILHGSCAYTPILYAGGTVVDPAALGAGGSITGTMCRQGAEVRVSVNVVVGTSPSLPAGELRLGLPYARATPTVTIIGRAYFPGTTGVSGSATSGDVMSIGATNWLRILVPNAGAYLQTASLQAGSTVYASGSYMQ